MIKIIYGNHCGTFAIALTTDPIGQATCKIFLKGNTQDSRNYLSANNRPQPCYREMHAFNSCFYSRSRKNIKYCYPMHNI